jgi:NAD+ kinase
LFKSVGIVARYDKKQALKLAEELSEYLSGHGLEICLEDTLKGKLSIVGKMVPLKEMKTDFVITIGGDGTVLRTCIALPKPEPPILAVNMGVRGFLTEVDPKEACLAVDKILKSEFRVETCTKLSTVANGKSTPDALNDVVVSSGEPSKILYLQIYKDDVPVAQLEADGVIISTRTGSTGYTLSAGGPILDSEVDAVVLTPICSLTTFRSMVFPADSKIRIEPVRPKEMLVLVDGAYRRLLPEANSSVIVTRSNQVSSFIRFKADFYSRLESRLQFKGCLKERDEE